MGCVAQLVEQRSPKSPVGGSNPSALVEKFMNKKRKEHMTVSHKTSLLEQSRKRAEKLSKKKGKIGFLQSIKDELKKVSWTSKEDLIHCTKVVVGATFAFGLGIYVADLFIRGALKGLSNFVRMIGG